MADPNIVTSDESTANDFSEFTPEDETAVDAAWEESIDELSDDELTELGLDEDEIKQIRATANV